MKKKQFNIVDRSIGGPGSYAVAGRKSNMIEWVWNHDKSLEYFYVNNDILNPKAIETGGYGWIFESKAIIPKIYSKLPKVLDRFKTVFTHDSKLLKKFPDKCKFTPGGGIWVGGTYGKGEIKIYDKNKMVSFVSSSKLFCPLHHFRLKLANYYLKNPSEKVDVILGKKPGDLSQGWKPIYQTLNDYRYSIVIENNIDNSYFTEKILNCFATGTVPIYIGAKNIDHYFNPDGIIQITGLNKKNKIKKLINSLTKEDYENRKKAIEDNFKRCQKYACLEDYIYSNYLQ